MTAGLALWVLGAGAGSSLASTGVCDSSASAPQACIAAIQASGGVVNDIFKDANGLTAQQLPVYGQLVNAWPGCDGTAFAGCSGQDTMPYDCPGEYVCTGLPNTFANASAGLDTLDHNWWHPCRLGDHTLTNGCPAFTQCIGDGVGGSYFPWEGLVFDLGGPSNKVAIFAENDHGPQPCESTEYTVFLSDNPFAKDIVLDPKTTGIDPMKWNRAVLTKIYTEGWEQVRPADPVGHASCGDTVDYSVENDSFVTVYALPCGVTFRYTSIVAGNDGLDFAQCAFDSREAEVDAIAGLTETGSGVCPDADGDKFVDCNCPTAPPVCDCNDADPTIHPGAPEACDSVVDMNCDQSLSPCQAGLFCYQSLCVDKCSGPEFPCPVGSTCQSTPEGQLCVPTDCSVGGCPPGGICKNDICVPACTGVVCPGNQDCLDGVCKDLCANLLCPAGQLCQKGECKTPCTCFAAAISCPDPGTACDSGGTGLCVSSACASVSCQPTETCDPVTGTCVGFCNPNVVCPDGQKCVDPTGCVPLCTDVTCQTGFACDPKTGQCADNCANVGCLSPDVCVDGVCVPGSGQGGQGGAGGTGISGSSTSESSSGTAGGTGIVTESSGCSCTLANEQAGREGALFALASLGVFMSRRRRGRGA